MLCSQAGLCFNDSQICCYHSHIFWQHQSKLLPECKARHIGMLNQQSEIWPSWSTLLELSQAVSTFIAADGNLCIII